MKHDLPPHTFCFILPCRKCNLLFEQASRLAIANSFAIISYLSSKLLSRKEDRRRTGSIVLFPLFMPLYAENENFFHFLFTRTTSQSPHLREASCCRSYVYFLFLHAAIARCFASTAVVTAPTPPGTGVAADAFSSRPSQRTSPQSFPFSSTLIPTSISTAPSFK